MEGSIIPWRDERFRIRISHTGTLSRICVDHVMCSNLGSEWFNRPSWRPSHLFSIEQLGNNRIRLGLGYKSDNFRLK
jgi:hypothetical protein